MLSFPQMLPGAPPAPAGLPMMAVVGDLVVSLETAARQAKARGSVRLHMRQRLRGLSVARAVNTSYIRVLTSIPNLSPNIAGGVRVVGKKMSNPRRHSLRTEVRILMVHGLLHLLGHDHEGDQAESLGPAMAAAELTILKEMEWEGGGLIAAAAAQEEEEESDSPAASSTQTQTRSAGPIRQKIRLLGLDMDGTLLNSNVEVSERNAAAVRAAVAQGVLVFIATGKVRIRVLNRPGSR